MSNALKEAEFEDARAVAIVDTMRHAVTDKITTKVDLCWATGLGVWRPLSRSARFLCYRF